MPNWDNDEGPGFDHDWEPEVGHRRRSLYGRAQHPTRPARTWNGKSVYEMETDHIMNAILFCEKRFAEAKRNHAECFMQATGANQFYFQSPFEMFPEYIHLRNEWDERSAKQ